MLTAILTVAAHAAAPYFGRPVIEVLEEFREQGSPVAYSTALVLPELRVTVEPVAAGTMNRILEILKPHKLTLEAVEGIFVVVRADDPHEAPSNPVVAAADEDVLENITVSASRYEVVGSTPASSIRIGRQSVENMPDVGSDPIRITQRLPGVAASGASARAHFRGGELNEVGIILNGQRLFAPFHVRDYQNIFSTIDARAIDGVEIYTGGFPVRFGDRMSGVVVLESADRDVPRHTEIGISVFNTSLLLSGSRNDTEWLLSARRGNLDKVIQSKFGQPAYYDVFSELQFSLGNNTTVTANALYADDAVTIVLETDPAEREEVGSDTKSLQAWLQFSTRWSNRLTSRTAVSYTGYDNLRLGSTGDAEKVVAQVSDNRDLTEVGFRQDWTFRPNGTHALQWGFAAYNSEATFDYSGRAEYNGLSALFAGQASAVARRVTAAPSGGSYSAYLADRWKLSPTLVLQWGLRWDDQTYTGLASDSQLSPRIGLLKQWSDKLDLRISWGRYHQSQGIHELQVEDGLSNYWPAQRADQLIGGIQYRLSPTLELRVEAFHKRMRDMRPRFENLFDPLAPIPELQADRIRLEPSRASSTGLELSLNGSRGNLSWWSSYTLSRVQDRIEGRDEPRIWDQRHSFNAGLSWSGKQWELSIAANAHSGWRTTGLALIDNPLAGEEERPLVAVTGPRNALRLGTYTSVDLRVNRHFDVRRGSLSAFIEVSNALNRRNTCCIDWDIAVNDSGETALESSRDYWLPLLPAIGFLWEF
ncbi:MAG: TonB-dependent receptor [Pseudomonadota bacterium]